MEGGREGGRAGGWELFYLADCRVSAQALLRSTQMPALSRRQYDLAFLQGGVPGLNGERYERAWAQRQWRRCERIAEMWNRPALLFLRARHMVPPPPNVFLFVGLRRWSCLFCAWRDLAFAMATLLGYEEAQGPSACEDL